VPLRGIPILRGEWKKLTRTFGALTAMLPGALRGETFLTVVAVLAGVALFRPSSQP
jgi:hypothetical protein